MSLCSRRRDVTSLRGPRAGDCDRKADFNTYPKALGGHPDQRLADLAAALHTGKGGVHSDLAAFEGGWMRPRKGMTGAQIVEEFGADAVESGLHRFYSQPKWEHLLQTFEEAMKFTRTKKR